MILYKEPRYSKGNKKIPDTKWRIETIRNKIDFIILGEVFVSGKEVSKAMDEHRSIKGYMPYNIAKKKAEKKYPQANPILVIQIWEEGVENI